jgi:hypothetical protein
MTIDEAQNVLSEAGWNVGDVFVTAQGESFWQVYAFRGEQRIVANAPSQLDAWLEAVRAVESRRRLITAFDLGRLSGTSRNTIKLLSMNGTLPPFVGYDNGHKALFDLDHPKLQGMDGDHQGCNEEA